MLDLTLDIVYAVIKYWLLLIRMSYSLSLQVNQEDHWN